MDYKLVCSDIDGTLLNKNRELSQRTLAILKKVKDLMPVVLISSRMPKAMRHLQAEIGNLKHPLISYNGGLIQSYESGHPKALSSIEIPIDIAEHIIKFTKGSSIHVSLYNADEWYVHAMDKWAEREARNTKVQPEVSMLSQVCDRWIAEGKGAHKIMCMGEPGEIRLLYNYLMLHHSDIVHAYRSKDTYLEIASKKISKLSGLSILLDKLYDIQLSEVIAFGDNYNDEEMIAGVGMGVAVANARDEVKAVAKSLTLGNKEDGVAIFLEGLFIES